MALTKRLNINNGDSQDCSDTKHGLLSEGNISMNPETENILNNMISHNSDYDHDRLDNNANMENDKSGIVILRYACPICPNIYHTELGFRAHQEWHNAMSKHMNSSVVELFRIQVYECDFCSAAFTSEEKLRIHRRKYFRKDVPILQREPDHDPNKPFHCKICGCSFRQQSTLEAHSVIHVPPSHVCQCGVAFYRKCDLEAHRILLNHSPSEPGRQQQPPENSSDNTKIKANKKLTTSEFPLLKAALTSKQTHKNNKGPIKTKKKAEKIITSTKKDDKPISTDEKEQNKHKTKNSTPKQIECRVGGEVIYVKLDDKGEYECTYSECGERFRIAGSFKRHMRRDHGWSFDFERLCEHCGKRFNCLQRKEIHMVVHTRERAHKCRMCNKGFSQINARIQHELRHTGTRRFKCDVCPKAFYCGTKLKFHSRVHTGEKPLACDTCGKRFADPSAFRRHRLIHTGLKPYKCDVCPKAFCDFSALYRHRRMHQGFVVRCNLCTRSFSSRHALANHERIEHAATDEKRYQCDHCGKAFPTKPYLYKHIVHFHMQRETVCELCNKLFSTSKRLQEHVESAHSGRYPHRCEVCSRLFAGRSTLLRHRNEEHGSFICEYCSATFTTNVSLSNHIKYWHLGHKCGTCHRSFTTAEGLKKHSPESCVQKPGSSKEDHIDTRWINKEDQKDRSEAEDQRKRHKYECNHCGNTFRKKKSIVDHILDIHMIALYCHICMKRFIREADFQRHKLKGGCTPFT